MTFLEITVLCLVNDKKEEVTTVIDLPFFVDENQVDALSLAKKLLGTLRIVDAQFVSRKEYIKNKE